MQEPGLRSAVSDMDSFDHARLREALDTYSARVRTEGRKQGHRTDRYATISEDAYRNALRSAARRR
jgi:hypothetical protein